MKVVKFASIAIVSALMASAANSAVITFDDGSFSAGDDLDGGSFSVGDLDFAITGSTNVGNGGPTIFDTDNPTGGDFDLESPFPGDVPGETLEAGLALILNEDDDFSDPDDAARGGVITFVFDQLVSLVDLDLLDLGDGNEVAGLTVAVDGTEVVTGLTVAGDGFFRNHLLDTIAGNTFTFSYVGSGAIDNLNFSVVPVPAGLPLLLTGLGAVALASRKRKS